MEKATVSLAGGTQPDLQLHSHWIRGKPHNVETLARLGCQVNQKFGSHLETLPCLPLQVMGGIGHTTVNKELAPKTGGIRDVEADAIQADDEEKHYG